MDERFSQGFTAGILVGLGSLVVLLFAAIAVALITRGPSQPTPVAAGPGNNHRDASPAESRLPATPPPSDDSAEFPETGTPSIEVMQLTTRLKENRSTFQKHEWRMTLRNNLPVGIRFMYRVHWIDAQGTTLFSTPFSGLLVLDAHGTYSNGGEAKIPHEVAVNIASVTVDIEKP